LQQALLQTKKRIESIDLLRGIVIVIMALDHVRDYFHAGNFLYDPADITQTNAPVFFTRWITHFCAPVFVFLAGTSAFLVGERKTKKALSLFLLKRGLWLMFLEVAVISFAWSFNPHFITFRLQVIWILGLSMVCMSGIIYLSPKIILATGLLILFTHNLFDGFHVTGNNFSDFLLAELHERRRFNFGGHYFTTGYSIIAWLSIMMLGYCFGGLYKKGIQPSLRKKYLLIVGIVAIALFIILRGINLYGDMAPWQVQPAFIMTVCSFLNVTKYPPSLLYTLMTLGPALIMLALLEKPLTSFGKIMLPIGRVPLFFYILHLFLIHLLAIIAVVVSGRPWTDMIFTSMQTAKDAPWLKGYGYSLAGTYVVWILVIMLLYPLCKWYDKYKTAHKEKWWLSYL
jgi:uncharacterized membrane protein